MPGSEHFQRIMLTRLAWKSAERYFTMSLQIASELGAPLPMLTALLAYATLKARTEAYQKALSLLTFIHRYPSTPPTLQAQAIQVLAEVMPHLPPAVMMIRLIDQQQTSLERFVESILLEW